MPAGFEVWKHIQGTGKAPGREQDCSNSLGMEEPKPIETPFFTEVTGFLFTGSTIKKSEGLKRIFLSFI